MDNIPAIANWNTRTTTINNQKLHAVFYGHVTWCVTSNEYAARKTMEVLKKANFNPYLMEAM